MHGIHSSIASDFQRCFVVEFLPVPPCTREKYEKLRLPAWTAWKKKVERENDEPGLRSRNGRVAIKNCPTFRRRSDSTPIVSHSSSSFFRFSFHFYSSIPFSFFSILHRVAACQLLVTRDPGIEPIVSKLAKSPWKNRALSNSTLSLLVSNLFPSKFLLFPSFLLLRFNFFYHENPVILFILRGIREGRDKF